MKNMDENLNLKQLLATVENLGPNDEFQLYYDPVTSFFFINYQDVIPFWIPRGAFYIGKCKPCNVLSGIEKLIAYAIKKLTESDTT